MTDIEVTFEHEDTFTAAAPTGNVRLGKLESLYEELFADVIADGVITLDERAQLDKMADSLAVVRGEWQRMAEKGANEEELAGAKKYLNGSFPLELSSSEALAELLGVIQRDHLGLDYFDRRSGLINAVTLEDVRRVARRILRVAEIGTVVVGDPKGM